MWFSRKPVTKEVAFFPWSKGEYSIGLNVFDLEHERLAALISSVHEAVLVDRDRAKAGRLLEHLIEQTRAHFNHEERSMADVEFPGLQAHVEEHERLLTDLRGLLRQFQSGTLSAMALPKFLKEWLVPHIQDSDRLYAPVVKRFGNTQT
jgi:hemerythrin-like metal-binding protein